MTIQQNLYLKSQTWTSTLRVSQAKKSARHGREYQNTAQFHGNIRHITHITSLCITGNMQEYLHVCLPLSDLSQCMDFNSLYISAMFSLSHRVSQNHLFHSSIVFSPNIPGSGVARLPTHRQILGEVPSSPPLELLLLHFDSSIWRQLISLKRLQLELSPQLLLRFVGRRPGRGMEWDGVKYDEFKNLGEDVQMFIVFARNGAVWIMLNSELADGPKKIQNGTSHV